MGHLLHLHPITIAALLIFGSALLKGGPAERIGALLMIADWASSLAAVALLSRPGPGSAPAVPVEATLGLDFLFSVGLLALAMRFGKMWLGVAMVLQGLMLAMHAMALSKDAPGFVLYVASLNVMTCLLLLSLLCGTVSAWRRRVAKRRATQPSPVRPPALAA